MDFLEFTGKVGALMVTDGSCSVRVNGKAYTLKHGDVMLVTPVLIYEDFTASGDLQTLTLQVDVHTFIEQMKQHFQIAFYSYILKRPVHHLSDDELFRFSRQIAEIGEFWRSAHDPATPEPIRSIRLHCHSLSSQSLVLSLVSLILLRGADEVFPGHDSPAEPPPFGDLVVPQFILNLNNHFRRERSVAFYARLANLSVGHFSSVVRKKTGMPPMHWIVTTTINNAKVMLKHKDMSIKEIAHSLGFPEQYTFRKYFKQYTGMSPTEFRES